METSSGLLTLAINMTGKLNFPPPKPLPNFPMGGMIPHVIVADEAFPLTQNIMRPFLKFIFQDALISEYQARKTIEAMTVSTDALLQQYWEENLAY